MMLNSPTDVNARIARSLREHGVRHTLRAILRHINTSINRFLDRHFDAAFGTDTRGVIENEALSDVVSPNLTRGIRYEPTRALPLRRVLRAARVPTDGGFVDLGCGKGRALMVAVLCGFPQVTGVDYSRELCAIAERNLDLLRARTRRKFTSSVIAMDAADYTFTKNDTVVYLFNPFDAVVLAAVIARLRRSLEQHPRAVWIVYHNPVHRTVIETTTTTASAGESLSGAPAFTHVADYAPGGARFAVYRGR